MVQCTGCVYRRKLWRRIVYIIELQKDESAERGLARDLSPDRKNLSCIHEGMRGVAEA